MDVGRFKRSKSIFLAWLVAPLVLIGAVHGLGLLLSQAVYSKSANMASQEALLPRMEEKYEEACRALDAFAAPGERDLGSADSLNALFQEAGAACGLLVDSVAIEPPKRGGAEAPASEITMSGIGPVESIIRYLDYFQGHANLFVVRDTTIRITEFQPEIVYACAFVFQYHQSKPVSAF